LRFATITEVTKSALIEVRGTSSQQMNSVDVRQLVLIADIRWVAAKEVEIDKSRVVRTI
jgi:hypothetical protein